MVYADWEDKGFIIGDGSNEIYICPSDAEELINRLRKLLNTCAAFRKKEE